MPGQPERIFLVGPMGSGKTTIGRLLAGRLDMGFYDCDEAIEKRTGASINLIFDIEGEEGFRDRESAMLRELATRERALIATGGGAVLDPDNRRLMADKGFVIWLNTPVEQQARRLAMDQKRPLLQTDDWRQRLDDLARQRDPLYADCADLDFPSRQRSVHKAVRLLHQALLDAWNPPATETEDAAY